MKQIYQKDRKLFLQYTVYIIYEKYLPIYIYIYNTEFRRKNILKKIKLQINNNSIFLIIFFTVVNVKIIADTVFLEKYMVFKKESSYLKKNRNIQLLIHLIESCVGRKTEVQILRS